MDKYEYNLKLDQMKSLSAEEHYAAAAEIADTINWSKIKNISAMVTAGEVYEKLQRYEESRDVLLLAYDRSPIGRTIVFRLAEVSIKMGDFDNAQVYYNEFVDVAPHDNLRFVLKYDMRKAQGADYSELIPILEELKESEYTEEWAYELAYLYHKAGMPDKCVDACDELILWFGDGPYVERALELKMIYQPLTKVQEEKYRRFRLEKQGITPISAEEMEKAGEYIHEDVEIPEVELDVSTKFNTVNLQKEIAKGMQQIINATEKETVSDTIDNIKKIVEDIPYLTLPQEDEEELDIKTDKEIDGSLQVNFQELLGEEEDGQMSLVTGDQSVVERQITGQLTIQDILDEWKKTQNAAQKALEKADQAKLESAKARALHEAESIMERLTDVMPKLDAGMTPVEILREKYMEGVTPESIEAMRREQEAKAAQAVEDAKEAAKEIGVVAEVVTVPKAEKTAEKEPFADPSEIPAMEITKTADRRPGISIESVRDMGMARPVEINGIEDEEISDEEIASFADQPEDVPETPIGGFADRAVAELEAELEEQDQQRARMRVREGRSEEEIRKQPLSGVSGQAGAVLRQPSVGVRQPSSEPGPSPAVNHPPLNVLDQPSIEASQPVNALEPSLAVTRQPSSVPESSPAEVRPSSSATEQPLVGERPPLNAARQPSSVPESSPAEVRPSSSATEQPLVGERPPLNAARQPSARVRQSSNVPEQSSVEIRQPSSAPEPSPAVTQQPSNVPGPSSAVARQTSSVPEPSSAVTQQPSNVPGPSSATEQPLVGERPPLNAARQSSAAPGETAAAIQSRLAAMRKRLAEESQTVGRTAAADAEILSSQETAEFPVQETRERLAAGLGRSVGEKPMQAEELPEIAPIEPELPRLTFPSEGIAEESALPSSETVSARDSSSTEMPSMASSAKQVNGRKNKGRVTRISIGPAAAVKAKLDADADALAHKLAADAAAARASMQPIPRAAVEETVETADGLAEVAANAIRTAGQPDTQGKPISQQQPQKEPAGQAAEEKRLGEPGERTARMAADKIAAEIKTMFRPDAEEAVIPESGSEIVPDLSGKPKKDRQNTKPIPSARELKQALRKRQKEDTLLETIVPKEMLEYYDDSTPKQEVRHLTEEQKATFSYFVPVSGMENQLAEAIANVGDHLKRKEAAFTGNLIIQGGQGCGKTVLATSMIRALQKEVGRPNNKIGKIDAATLNKKDISLLLKKVSGGCLIIEEAGGLNQQAAQTLSLLMDSDDSGLLVILEDTSKGIKRALAQDQGFAKKFTQKITVPIFTNDDLVAFAKSYSEELGYRIDELAVLALYNRISNIQRLDQATTLTEVKDIVDEAIDREARGGIQKFFSILTAKRYDDDDKIILQERDFE